MCKPGETAADFLLETNARVHTCVCVRVGACVSGSDNESNLTATPNPASNPPPSSHTLNIMLKQKDKWVAYIYIHEYIYMSTYIISGERPQSFTVLVFRCNPPSQLRSSNAGCYGDRQ